MNSATRRALLAHGLSLLAAAQAAGLLACDSSDAAAQKPDPPPVTAKPPEGVPPLHGEGDPSAGRGVRRLALDELAASVRVVAGKDAGGAPIDWRVYKDGAWRSGFEDAGYGRVLGRPDYVNITEEGAAPGSLELKFIRDMARDVCDQMVRADLARDAGQERTLLRHAAVDGAAAEADVIKNVQYLVLRFLGLRLPEGDRQVKALVRLHAAASASVDHAELSPIPAPAEGWRAVCIALFEDPAFYVD